MPSARRRADALTGRQSRLVSCSDVQKEIVEKQSMKGGKYVGIAIASAIFTTAGCGRHVEADPRTEPELVRVVVVEPSHGASQFFTGVVSARVQSDLGFRVSGKVTRRLVDVGQHVHAGEPLMWIDVTYYSPAITTPSRNVASAKARADQAVADEQRYRGLVRTGAV